MSPEIYVLKYHLWLAGGAKGLLSVGVVNPMLESVMLMALLVWLSWHTSEAAQFLTQRIVGLKTGPDPDHPPEQEGYALLPTSRSCTEASDEKEEDTMGPHSNGSWWSGYIYHILKDWRWRLVLLVVVLWGINLLSNA
jgi:hypothetical protein